MLLEPDFRDKLEEAVLENAVKELMGNDGVVFKAIDKSHEKLEESGYDVDNVIDSLVEPTVDESGDTITITWGWTHEAADYFERGTSFHRIDGDTCFPLSGKTRPVGFERSSTRPEVRVVSSRVAGACSFRTCM